MDKSLVGRFVSSYLIPNTLVGTVLFSVLGIKRTSRFYCFVCLDTGFLQQILEHVLKCKNRVCILKIFEII